VAGRQEGDRLARGAGAGKGEIPDPAVEPASVSYASKVFAVALLAALAWAVVPVSEAQAPIRIGATLAQTGVYATSGQTQLRGYQLCVQHMNEKGGVLGRKVELVVYDDASDPARAVRLYEQLITRDKWIWCSVRSAGPSPTPWPT
jgi:ABC-type branched-subunit amino acid transport system substrate-binding protein